VTFASVPVPAWPAGSFEAGADGKPGEGVKRGDGGPGGKGGVEYPPDTWYKGEHYYQAICYPDGNDGPFGGSRGAGAAAPTRPQVGKYAAGCWRKDFDKKKVLDFVHVSQLQMVFQKARMHYLAAGETLAKPDELPKAQVLLNWLGDVLEAVIAADPPSDVAGQAHSLESRVLALKMNIFRGLNHFGREPDYVPRQSLSQYQE
jgi:hypothetical protein